MLFRSRLHRQEDVSGLKRNLQEAKELVDSYFNKTADLVDNMEISVKGIIRQQVKKKKPQLVVEPEPECSSEIDYLY